MPRLPAVAVLLVLTVGSLCANAQTPAYTVQIVPDPPVPTGYPHPQRDPNFVLPDGRFVISHGYSNGGPWAAVHW